MFKNIKKFIKQIAEYGNNQEVKIQPSDNKNRNSGSRNLITKQICSLQSNISLNNQQISIIYQFFATDTCERCLLLEKAYRNNESPSCWKYLTTIRNLIYKEPKFEIKKQLEEAWAKEYITLNMEDQKRVLFESVLQLFIEEPEERADAAFLFTMLRLVRYAGPWVDIAREREAEWHAQRIRWWVEKGIFLDNKELVYTESEQLLEIPETASLHYKI